MAKKGEFLSIEVREKMSKSLLGRKLSEETKKEIQEARAEINSGKFYTLAQIKKELNL